MPVQAAVSPIVDSYVSVVLPRPLGVAHERGGEMTLRFASEAERAEAERAFRAWIGTAAPAGE